jgi:hypothetical protein
MGYGWRVTITGRISRRTADLTYLGALMPKTQGLYGITKHAVSQEKYGNDALTVEIRILSNKSRNGGIAWPRPKLS